MGKEHFPGIVYLMLVLRVLESRLCVFEKSKLTLRKVSAGDGGYEVVTTYDQQGFPETITQLAGAATAVKSYNEQGFLITNSPSLTPRASPTALADNAASSAIVAAGTSAPQKVSEVVSASAKGAAWKAADLGLVFAGWLFATLLMP